MPAAVPAIPPPRAAAETPLSVFSGIVVEFEEPDPPDPPDPRDVDDAGATDIVCSAIKKICQQFNKILTIIPNLPTSTSHIRRDPSILLINNRKEIGIDHLASSSEF